LEHPATSRILHRQTASQANVILFFFPPYNREDNKKRWSKPSFFQIQDLKKKQSSSGLGKGT
jgi:hypothetical protein